METGVVIAAVAAAIAITVLYCCLVVAGRADEELERHFEERHDEQEGNNG